ncbi:hypothetical protein EP463_16940 [Salmonella enterica]|nr:hypothetical protein [Salmonella enterica]
MAFSGLVLLPLSTPYPFRPLSFGWRRLVWLRPDAAPELCTKITPKYLASNGFRSKNSHTDFNRSYLRKCYY